MAKGEDAHQKQKGMTCRRTTQFIPVWHKLITSQSAVGKGCLFFSEWIMLNKIIRQKSFAEENVVSSVQIKPVM